MKKLLIATHNKGKADIYAHCLKGIGLKLLSLKDIGINDKPDERADTLEENAKEKSLFYFEKSGGIPTLADDSCVEIDALGGEPGVHTRRWPGYSATDDELIALTMQKIKGIEKENRKIRYRAVVCFALGPQSIYNSDGFIEGIIAETPLRDYPRGFPFDSLFLVPSAGKILAEMTFEDRNRAGIFSHREKALQKLMPYIKKYAKS